MAVRGPTAIRHYRPEKPSSNRSHKAEDKSGNYKGP